MTPYTHTHAVHTHTVHTRRTVHARAHACAHTRAQYTHGTRTRTHAHARAHTHTHTVLATLHAPARWADSPEITALLCPPGHSRICSCRRAELRGPWESSAPSPLSSPSPRQSPRPESQPCPPALESFLSAHPSWRPAWVPQGHGAQLAISFPLCEFAGLLVEPCSFKLTTNL